MVLTGLVLGLFLVSACGKKRHLRKYYPIRIAENGYDTVYQTLIPFEVINQIGDTVRTADVLGDILVVDFFFASCPSICPAMSAEMSRVNEAYREDEDIRLLSFSIDPERDTIPALKAYADRFKGVAGKWDFLRGEGEDNRTLSERAFYLSALRDTTADGGFQHDPRLVLLDPVGRIRGYYPAMEPESIDRLIEDIAWLKAEAKK